MMARKLAKPTGHVSTRRWIKYVARNFPHALAMKHAVQRPERYLHASRTRK